MYKFEQCYRDRKYDEWRNEDIYICMYMYRERERGREGDREREREKEIERERVRQREREWVSEWERERERESRLQMNTWDIHDIMENNDIQQKGLFWLLSLRYYSQSSFT